jgi:hypothetical protein
MGTWEAPAIRVRRMPLARPLALTLLLGLGCVATAQAAPTLAASNSTDVALAKRIGYRVTDFPAGWSQVPSSSKSTGCFEGPLRKNSPTAFVDGARYSTGENGIDAYQTVVVYGSPAGAKRALASVSANTSFACYRGKLPAILAPAKLKLESYTGGPMSFDPLGDTLRAFRYKAAVSLGKEKDALYLDYIFVVRGRVLISFGFTQGSVEPGVYTEHAILQKVIARVPASGKAA